MLKGFAPDPPYSSEATSLQFCQSLARGLPMTLQRLRAWLRGKPRTIRNRHATSRLGIELLEDRVVPSTLTVITHGRQDQLALTPDQAPAWAFDMASAINVQDHLGYTETQIDRSV